MTFGAHAKALREKRGISLNALGKKIRINPGYLSKIERDKVPPSDKLIRALAREYNALELFNLAGKVIPDEFQPAKLFPNKLTEEAYQNWAKENYPRSDPWAGYGRQNIPDMLSDSDLSAEGIERLCSLGIMPEDIDLYPPLRKKIIDLAIIKLQWHHTDPIERDKHNSYLDGNAAGIKEAFAMLKRVQHEDGDYAILSAFYEPEIARAIAEFLAILKKLDVPNG